MRDTAAIYVTHSLPWNSNHPCSRNHCTCRQTVLFCSWWSSPCPSASRYLVSLNCSRRRFSSSLSCPWQWRASASCGGSWRTSLRTCSRVNVTSLPLPVHDDVIQSIGRRSLPPCQAARKPVHVDRLKSFVNLTRVMRWEKLQTGISDWFPPWFVHSTLPFECVKC